MAPRVANGVRTLAPLLLLALPGCDGFFHDAAPPGPVPLALTTSFSPVGPALNHALASAFDQANRVSVRVEVEETGVVLADETQTVTPDEDGIRLQLTIDLPEERVRVRIHVRLLLNNQVLFEGSFVTELVRGRPTEADVPLVPEPADLRVTGPTLIEALQETVQLQAELLMATGDPIPDAAFTWVPLDPGVATVSQTGVVTSVSEGEARIAAVSQGLADTVRVAVQAVVDAVQVTPPEASVAVGAQTPFQAVARDARGNPLSRTFSWSAVNTSVAQVNPSGVATGVAPGETQIRAAVGDVAGTAVLRVLSIVPVVVTGNATNVSPTSATVQGTVNPSGNPTQAWFEYGSSPTLGSFSSTTAAGVGGGTQPANFSQPLTGLPPAAAVYYRIAAQNQGGTARGEIRSFTTQTLTIPFAPTNLSAEPRVSGSTFLGFLLRWSDNSNNEERFELERAPSFTEGQIPFQQLVVVPANRTDAVDGSANPFDFYDYRVRACNAAGCSGYSTVYFVYYGSEGSPPNP